MYLIHLIFYLFTIFIFCKAQLKNESCVTGDGLVGFCSLKQNCPSFNDSESFINCGLNSEINYICCPNYTNLSLPIITYEKKTICGKHPDFFTIVGGKETTPHFYPWVVAIYQISSNNYYNFICGGSLISTRHVLSAAHCIKHGYFTLNGNNFLVKIGAHNLENTGKFYEVEQVFVHENYRGYQKYNDISLLKLKQEVHRNSPFIVCLPNLSFLNRILNEGVSLTVAGWGTTRFLGPLSTTLRSTIVKYINNNECTKSYYNLEQSKLSFPNGIDSTMICAGLREGGHDSCQGDSGGPLMYTDSKNDVYLVGIVSFGYRCAYPGYPGIYTKVSVYLNWINSKMRL